MTKFHSFNDFYLYYLTEHAKPNCRLLHYIGSMLVLLLLSHSISTEQYQLLWLLPVVGYGFAWFGHVFIEKNKPATFQYPLYSFIADWVMLKDFVTGQIDRKLKQAGVNS